MVNEVLPQLFEKAKSNDVNERHGSVLAIGEIITKLKQLDDNNDEVKRINEVLVERLSDVVLAFQRRDQFKGMSGELMFQCCCDFIRNCSSAKVAVTSECIGKNDSLYFMSNIN